jgi:hypothetical protein
MNYKLKRYGHPRFYKLLDEIADIHSRKNYNYAENGNPLSNLKSSERYFLVPGSLGTAIRMADKWERFCQLMKGKQDLVGESIKDTLKDFAIYCLLEIILLDEEANKKLK